MIMNKKGQKSALETIIRATIVIVVGLLIYLGISSGFIGKQVDFLLRITDDSLEGVEIKGDYIKRAVADIIDENTVALEFSLDSSHCGEIESGARQGIVIYEGFAPYPSDALEWKRIDTATATDTCTTKYTLDDIPLSHPGEVGARKLRLEVMGANDAILESLPIDLPHWKVLLFRYLNGDMSRTTQSVGGPHNQAIEWAIFMHTSPSFGLYDCEQSRNFAPVTIDEIDEFIHSISFNEGTFREFLIELGCAEGAYESVKQNTLQTIITAMYGDIQDFNEESSEPAHPDQKVPRMRDGWGVRGYGKNDDWQNQLLPVYIKVKYPKSDFKNSFEIYGQIRQHGCFSNWRKELGSSFTFETGEQSCFEGNEITIELYYCPLDNCRMD